MGVWFLVGNICYIADASVATFMRYFAIIIFSLLFTISEGKIIKLKFQLINDIDSTTAGLRNINIKPIKSYFVQEIEHHSNSTKRHNFKTFRFYYNSELSCIIFEYEAKEYPFNDIYLKIESDSFYYHRQRKSDYDEENSIHLKADDNQINKVYISPYRFINVYIGSFINNDFCFDIRLSSIIEKDTLPVKPIIRKNNLNVADTLIKTFAIPNRIPYFLLIEMYDDNELKFCYFDLGQAYKKIQSVSLSNLDYKEFKNFKRNPECLKYSLLTKQLKHIEYFDN